MCLKFFCEVYKTNAGIHTKNIYYLQLLKEFLSEKL